MISDKGELPIAMALANVVTTGNMMILRFITLIIVGGNSGHSSCR